MPLKNPFVRHSKPLEPESEPVEAVPVPEGTFATPEVAAILDRGVVQEEEFTFRNAVEGESWRVPLIEALDAADAFVKACPAGDKVELAKRQERFAQIAQVVNTRLYHGG